MRAALLCAVVVALLLPSVAAARTYKVKTQAAYLAAVKKLAPGDTVVLADGEWRDFEILFTGQGSAEEPITLRGETPGRVIITGASNLRLAGAHLVVRGLVFRDGHTPTNTVIAFRRTKGELAFHSRVTEVVIDGFNNPERFETDFWVMMYGRHNRFDHNHLSGKSNKGVTMAVRLDSEASRENHHRIDHNYFGPRPVLGSNGGETLRIGTSHHSLTDSHTVVENNFFERCDGEVEIISNKSGRNVFRGNVFVESRGTLTLRHGNDNIVEGNIFLGNGVPHTGGIRVINKRQVVRNNYLAGLTGHRFGGALVVMNGVPKSPINRYHRVEDTTIENNSIINSDHIELAAGSDAERSAVPLRTKFRRNLIYNEDGRNNIAVHDDVSGILFEDNVFNLKDAPKLPGFARREIEWETRDGGLLFPAGDAFKETGARPPQQMLRREETGAAWYAKPSFPPRFEGGKTRAVPATEDALKDALREAERGDTLLLAPGEHVVRHTLVVTVPVTVKSASADARAAVLFERNALFEIADGGSLLLAGLDISGARAPDTAGNSVIRTSRYSMLENYVLLVEDCRVTNLDTNHSFNFLTTAKHTFAGRVEISGSVFRDVTGHIITMTREREDLGIYNGEYISIRASKFEKVQGAVADLYRGGTDESTFGPHFSLQGSELQAVGHGKRNKAAASVRLHGVQRARITGNHFRKSQPVRVVHTVGEPQTQLRANTFDATAPPQVGDVAAL